MVTETSSVRGRMKKLLAIAALIATATFAALGFATPAQAEKNVEKEFIDPTVYWWGICGDEDDDDPRDPRDLDGPVDELTDNDKLVALCLAVAPTGEAAAAPARG